jgi:arsenite-transporting ATPase
MEYSNLSVDAAESAGLQSVMNLPGVDELETLSSLFDSLERDNFDVVMFDTGHTTRLLQLPQNCESVLSGVRMFGRAGLSLASQLFGGLAGEELPGWIQTLLANAVKRFVDPTQCSLV